MKGEKYMSNIGKDFDYNDIPVYYCKQCLSLKIKTVPHIMDMDYCDDCNSTNIDKTSIFEWEKMFEDRYGYKFLNKSNY